jgi:hypothetical protein
MGQVSAEATCELPQPNAFHASFGLTRCVTSSGRCQTRGGRKGGLPVCEGNGLLAKSAAIFAQAEGKTMIEDNVPAKLKHLSTQVAMAAQSSMAFSHGLALGGQQSVISSIMDMSAGSADLTLTPAPPAAGRIPTDKAIRTARIVRPMPMDQ